MDSAQIPRKHEGERGRVGEGEKAIGHVLSCITDAKSVSGRLSSTGVGEL
jgi:hypothetical protein